MGKETPGRGQEGATGEPGLHSAGAAGDGELGGAATRSDLGSKREQWTPRSEQNYPRRPKADVAQTSTREGIDDRNVLNTYSATSSSLTKGRTL